MGGYTPVFRSVFEGTLCGQYPDTAAWLYLLALSDKNGHVDKTPQYISAVTGMPVEELTACIERFMQPDPGSRSAEDDGRRLTLIDPSRSWGWVIVNHGKYREKARLASKNAREIEEGKNAERLRDRRGPPGTAGDRPSYANANANANTDKKVPTEPMSGAKRPTDSEEVAKVFNHWRTVHGHPTAKLDDKRRKVIRNALKSYSADELCEAIAGYLNSPHHMGINDRSTRYDSLELLLRDAQHIDAGIKFGREPPPKFSKLTQENLDRTAEWVPPEVRNAGQ